MKNKAPLYTFIFVVLTVLLTYVGGAIIDNKKDIIVSDPEWSCDLINKEWVCLVKFYLQNKTNEEFSGKISVRGLAMKKNDRFSNATLSKDHFVEFIISDYERKSFATEIYSERKPSKVNLTIINRKIM